MGSKGSHRGDSEQRHPRAGLQLPLRQDRGTNLSVGECFKIPDSACKEIHFFLQHWLRLKGAAAMPPCESLDPLDFFSYLSRVFIAEGDDIDNLRIRLAGTVYRELYGFEITGRPVAELIPFHNRQDLLDSYRRCILRREPVYEQNTMTWRERGSDVSFERILLPFGSDNHVERMLGFAQFFDSEQKKIFA